MADIDTSMISSPSASSSSASNSQRPATPPKHTSAARAAELSPPNSQERLSGTKRTARPQMPDSDAMDLTMEGGEDTAGGKGKGKADEERSKPGWSYQNPVAVEEYQRCMENILDRDFNLRQFGELLDGNSTGVGKK